MPTQLRTIPRVCLFCHMDFLAQPGEVKRGRANYCSRKCSTAHRRAMGWKSGYEAQPVQPRICPECGSTFMPSTHADPKIYCSHRCGSKSKQPLADRFWSKVDRIGGPNACWVWKGGQSGGRYGAFNLDGRNRGAHEIAWELDNECEVPEGMYVCHHCDNPVCVRPNHLFLGTSSDNRQDALRKGRITRLGRTLQLHE